MLSPEDAVALSLSFFESFRIAEVLRRFYPRPEDPPAGAAELAPAPEAPPEDLAVVFDYLCGIANGAAALSQARERAGEALSLAAERGLEALCWSSPSYPPLLAAIPDPPPVLWVAGRVQSLVEPLVAVVGSRAASPYAIDCAGRLACAIAARGFGVVSGLARGVDGASHRGALRAGGTTVAVLGCGADVVYPAEHRALAGEVRRSGAIVSELAPGTPPQPFHFPRRNRIISGLASGVVVIEASEKSGSLITARAALEQGREVMAVPGNVLNGRNRGGNRLIKDGGVLVEDADDVLAALGHWPALASRRAVPKAAEETDRLLEAMVEGESYDLDDLGSRTGLAPAELLSALLRLELGGSLRREGGGRFVRVGGSC